MKIAILLPLAVFSLHAATLFDTSPPDLGGNAGDFVNARLADSFDLTSAANIDQINFWYVTEQFGSQSDLTNAAWAIYSDSSGQLGAELASGDGAPTTSPYDTADYQNTYLAQLSIPTLLLGAGDYWLELHGGSSLTDDNGGLTVLWAASDASNSYQALMNAGTGLPNTPITVPGYETYAFQIEGGAASGVPEPGTLATIALGLACLISVAHGNRRKGWCAPKPAMPNRSREPGNPR